MMKNKAIDFVSPNFSEVNFNELSISDMYAIRGGASTEPPLPSTGGDDFPIVINPKLTLLTTTTLLAPATSTSTSTIETDSDEKDKGKKGKKRF